MKSSSQPICFILLGLVAGQALVSALPVEDEAAGSGRFKRDAGSKKGATKDASFQKECLSAQNNWRRMHGANDLKMDDYLTKYAQWRADSIASSGKFEHISENPYGENLAMHSDETQSCTNLAKMCMETGHFTQLVWRSSQRVGCARSISGNGRGNVYLVCVYDPPGNYQGEYQDNVLPAKASKKSVTSSGRGAKEDDDSGLRVMAGASENVAPTTTASPTNKPKKNKKNKKGKKSKKNKRKSTTTTTTTSGEQPPSTTPQSA